MKEFLYKLLNLATLGRGMKRTINGHDVRLPTRYYRFFRDDYEAENFKFLFEVCKPGDTILDFGAHIGLFSAIASKAVGNTGKIYAFEPSPSTNALLQKTVAINNIGKIVKTFQKAAGGETGKTTFFVSDGKVDNANSLVNYKEDRPFHGIEVEVTTIDIFVKEQQLSKVDFIKIDVEGAEYDVLKGAVETLTKLRPACILAIHPEPIQTKGDSLGAIYDLVKQCNYQILHNGQPISKETFCSSTGLIDLNLLPA